MSFGFNAGGTAEETVSSLQKLTAAELGNDRLGIAARDLIISAITSAGNLDETSRQVYVVRAAGQHSDSGPVTFSMSIELGNRHTPE